MTNISATDTNRDTSLEELLQTLGVTFITNQEVRKIRRSLCDSWFSYLLSLLPPFVHKNIFLLIMAPGMLSIMGVLVHWHFLVKFAGVLPLSGWLYFDLWFTGLLLILVGILYDWQEKKAIL